MNYLSDTRHVRGNKWFTFFRKTQSITQDSQWYFFLITPKLWSGVMILYEPVNIFHFNKTVISGIVGTIEVQRDTNNFLQ